MKTGKLPFRIKLLATLMRHLPVRIRRVEMMWRALYEKLGAGSFEENPEIDCKWPAGLQAPIVGKLHRYSMRLNLQDWLERRTFFRGRYYQEAIEAMYLAMLAKGDQYIDVGANIGMLSLLAARCIGDEGQGFSVEPNPDAFARLAVHLSENGIKNIKPIRAAFGERSATTTLMVLGKHSGLGHLVQKSADRVPSMTVKVIRGDRLTPRLNKNSPIFMKVDVEGYEVNVLRGLGELLKKKDVAMIIEVTEAFLARAGESAKSLHEFMRDHDFNGYSFSLISHRFRRQLAVRECKEKQNRSQYDVLFIKNASHVFHQRLEKIVC